MRHVSILPWMDSANALARCNIICCTPCTCESICCIYFQTNKLCPAKLLVDWGIHLYAHTYVRQSESKPGTLTIFFSSRVDGGDVSMQTLISQWEECHWNEKYTCCALSEGTLTHRDKLSFTSIWIKYTLKRDSLALFQTTRYSINYVYMKLHF